MGRLITQVDVPAGTCGNWKVEKKTISTLDANVSAINSKGRYVPAGTYTFLYRGGTLVMSDTPDEMRDHTGIVHAAKGQVLIAGLGIGMVVQACLERTDFKADFKADLKRKKTDEPAAPFLVDKVTVIEKSPDVISLVGGHYQKKYGARVEIIQADIFDWKLPKGARWDAAWYDVWDSLCADNLPEMTRLKRKFGRRAEWQGCWGEYQCRRDAKRWKEFIGR